ncbi:MAG: HEAT repeat domain-containing protein [Planctomycetes bacterium]|nr:HEAT repeat domain-containing protein [Planctomycetota bacterium]MCC7172194.1 HEAT repeat domain-containing protein [Planctomycetota bacterium]
MRSRSSFARLAPLVLVLAFPACRSTPDDIGVPLTQEEIEYQKRLQQAVSEPVTDEGRARLILQLDQSLSVWFRSSLDRAGSPDRRLVDNIESVLQRTAYRNVESILQIARTGTDEQRAIACAALGFCRLAEPSDAAARERFRERFPPVYPRATAVLIENVGATNPAIVQNALLGLWKLGDPETPLEPVLARLDTKDADVRSNAVLALGAILTPETGERAIERILTCLYDNDAKVRNHAISAIASMRHTDASGRLTQLLDDNYLLIQANAARALGELGDWRNAQALVVRLERLKAQMPAGKYREKTGLDYGRDQVVQNIAAALRKLSGEDFGDDPKLWREWWNERATAGG